MIASSFFLDNASISAPKSVPIYRKEVYAQILDSNKEAASSVDVKSLNQLFKK